MANDKVQKVPTEAELRLFLKNGMKDLVQQVLDIAPDLRLKLEKNGGRFPDEGEWVLVELLSGASAWLKKFITCDSDMIEMKEDVKKLAVCNDEVLITGETGTGKELIARALHGDREGDFKRINCGAMPSELIESELFGHVKGAFTGADNNKTGLLVAAKDGTMFLDEVGDLPYTLQAKLLNALQPIDGKRFIRPVGSVNEVEINCRIVAATHKDLRQMFECNQFRKDLYARLSTFEIHISPLSKRVGDVEPIVRELCAQMGVDYIKVMDGISAKSLNKTLDLSFNVRSLEQMVKRYRVLGKL